MTARKERCHIESIWPYLEFRGEVRPGPVLFNGALYEERNVPYLPSSLW
jgi:hypothetical protein